MHTHMHAYTCVWVCTHILTCMCACMSVCVCVSMCEYLQSLCICINQQNGRKGALTTEQWASKVNLASRIKHWG